MNIEEVVLDFLANLHLVQIEEIIIEPAVNQIIKDTEDYLFMEQGSVEPDEESIRLNTLVLDKYKHIREMHASSVKGIQ